SFSYKVSRLVVDRAQEVPGIPGAALGCAVALRMRVRVGQVEHCIRLRCADIDQTGVRIETRRLPICGAARAWRNQNARDLRVLFGIANRLSLRIDTFIPVGRLQVRFRQKILTIGAIENEEKPVAADLRKQLALSPVHDTIEENRNLSGIPIVSVVW